MVVQLYTGSHTRTRTVVNPMPCPILSSRRTTVWTMGRTTGATPPVLGLRTAVAVTQLRVHEAKIQGGAWWFLKTGGFTGSYIGVITII